MSTPIYEYLSVDSQQRYIRDLFRVFLPYVPPERHYISHLTDVFQCGCILLVLEIAQRRVIGKICLVSKGVHCVRILVPSTVVIWGRG